MDHKLSTRNKSIVKMQEFVQYVVKIQEFLLILEINPTTQHIYIFSIEIKERKKKGRTKERKKERTKERKKERTKERKN